MKAIKAGSLLPFAIMALTGSTAHAAMGNGPSTYGILPHDIASAQAFSVFNAQSAAAYYNPAALPSDPRGEFTSTITHVKHELELIQQDLATGTQPVRTGTVVQGEPSQMLLLGFKKNLTSLTTFEHPIYLGVTMGLERVIKELLSFSPSTSTEGQYFQYGRQPLFLTFGMGTNIWRGVSVGWGLQANMRADANMYLQSSLAGETEYEELNLSAEPVLRPTFGFRADLGKTFCPDADCFWDNFDIAIGYRGYSKVEARINAEAEIPGTVTNPGLMLRINAIDTFQPKTTSFGLLTRLGTSTRLAFVAETQEWSRLGDEFSGDTLRDQGPGSFEDITIPRIGVEYDFAYRWGVPRATLIAGVSFVPSPLEENADTIDVNYVDADKTVFGVGVRFVEPNVPLLRHEMQLEFGYQYHMLENRTFDLYSTNTDIATSSDQPYDRVETDGDVHVVGASFTLRF